MSDPEFSSIFYLKFYRKQKKWRFGRNDAPHKRSPVPESASALLSQTYNVEVPKELSVSAMLDEAFIADPSSGGEEALSENSEPSGLHQDSAVPAQGPTLKYPDQHSSDMSGLSLPPEEYGQETPGSQDQSEARALEDYSTCEGMPRSPSEKADEDWRWELLELAEMCGEGSGRAGSAQDGAPAGWTAGAQDLWPEHFFQASTADGAERSLTEAVLFHEEQQLLRRTQRWLELLDSHAGHDSYESHEGHAYQRRRGDSPTLHGDADRPNGAGLWPEDRQLARSPGGGGEASAGSLSPLDSSLDSEAFMLGAHASPHSTMIQLPGETDGHTHTPLIALVGLHARALREVLAVAPAKAQRSAHDITSGEFPTRDGGPGGSTAGPEAPPAGRGRGRRRLSGPVVLIKAGRPYRI